MKKKKLTILINYSRLARVLFLMIVPFQFLGCHSLSRSIFSITKLPSDSLSAPASVTPVPPPAVTVIKPQRMVYVDPLHSDELRGFNAQGVLPLPASPLHSPVGNIHKIKISGKLVAYQGEGNNLSFYPFSPRARWQTLGRAGLAGNVTGFALSPQYTVLTSEAGNTHFYIFETNTGNLVCHEDLSLGTPVRPNITGLTVKGDYIGFVNTTSNNGAVLKITPGFGIGAGPHGPCLTWKIKTASDSQFNAFGRGEISKVVLAPGGDRVAFVRNTRNVVVTRLNGTIVFRTNTGRIPVMLAHRVCDNLPNLVIDAIFSSNHQQVSFLTSDHNATFCDLNGGFIWKTNAQWISINPDVYPELKDRILTLSYSTTGHQVVLQRDDNSIWIRRAVLGGPGLGANPGDAIRNTDAAVLNIQKVVHQAGFWILFIDGKNMIVQTEAGDHVFDSRLVPALNAHVLDAQISAVHPKYIVIKTDANQAKVFRMGDAFPVWSVPDVGSIQIVNDLLLLSSSPPGNIQVRPILPSADFDHFPNPPLGFSTEGNRKISGKIKNIGQQSGDWIAYEAGNNAYVTNRLGAIQWSTEIDPLYSGRVLKVVSTPSVVILIHLSGVASVRDPITGVQSASFNQVYSKKIIDATGTMNEITLLTEGHHFYTYGGHNYSILKWYADTTNRHVGLQLAAYSGNVDQAFFSPASNRIIIKTTNHNLVVLNAITGDEVLGTAIGSLSPASGRLQTYSTYLNGEVGQVLVEGHLLSIVTRASHANPDFQQSAFILDLDSLLWVFQTTSALYGGRNSDRNAGTLDHNITSAQISDQHFLFTTLDVHGVGNAVVTTKDGVVLFNTGNWVGSPIQGHISGSQLTNRGIIFQSITPHVVVCSADGFNSLYDTIAQAHPSVTQQVLKAQVSNDQIFILTVGGELFRYEVSRAGTLSGPHPLRAILDKVVDFTLNKQRIFVKTVKGCLILDQHGVTLWTDLAGDLALHRNNINQFKVSSKYYIFGTHQKNAYILDENFRDVWNTGRLYTLTGVATPAFLHNHVSQVSISDQYALILADDGGVRNIYVLSFRNRTDWHSAGGLGSRLVLPFVGRVAQAKISDHGVVVLTDARHLFILDPATGAILYDSSASGNPYSGYIQNFKISNENILVETDGLGITGVAGGLDKLFLLDIHGNIVGRFPQASHFNLTKGVVFDE